MNSKSVLLYSCILLVCLGIFFYPRWEKNGSEATLSWDVSGYYLYLPSIFIYQDINKGAFLEDIVKKYSPTPDPQQVIPSKNGNRVMRYTYGQSIMYLPYFLLAHIFTSEFQSFYPPDGFSYPYQICIGMGMLFYSIMGLYFLRKLLFNYFPDRVVSYCLLTLMLASNYLNYAAIDQGLTNGSLFFLYCLLLYKTIEYRKGNYSLNKLAFIIGLMIVIRPTEFIAVLIPFLFGSRSLDEIKSRLNTVTTKPREVVVFGLIIFGFVSIQLIYWKYVSGSWFVYTYQDQVFDWFRPNLYDFSFDYLSGWITYSPFMILVIPSLLITYKKYGMIIPLFFLLAYYITTSWRIYDYSWVSGRAMIQYLPFVMLLFGTFYEYIIPRRKFYIPVVLFFLLCAYLNTWWIYHSHAGSVQASRHTKETYWRAIGRWY